jgi:hypothetical protein
MSMTITIPIDLEPLLKAEAGKAGVDQIAYTSQLLRKSLSPGRPPAPVVSPEETRLLNETNQGLTARELDHYRHLIGKRQEETITEQELQELMEITCRLEALQIRRIENLAKLAAFRGVPLTDLMAQLEIRPADVL